MKIALLGKSGMLGSAFCELLGQIDDCELRAFGSGDLDVTDFFAVSNLLAELKPDFVVNCTGYTNVDLAERESEKAFLLNRDAVDNLGRLSISLGFKLIHFSTDYVFSGEQIEGYVESDAVGPLNVYGQSKLAGERALFDVGARAFVVRTAWLFGPNGKNFVNTMLALGKDNASVKVVNDQFGSPTFTYDLAKTVIDDFIFNERDFGIYHLTNKGKVSWYEFALKIFSVARMEVEVSAVSSEEFVRPAKRPRYGLLINTKLPLMRQFEEALDEYMDLHFR